MGDTHGFLRMAARDSGELSNKTHTHSGNNEVTLGSVAYSAILVDTGLLLLRGGNRHQGQFRVSVDTRGTSHGSMCSFAEQVFTIGARGTSLGRSVVCAPGTPGVSRTLFSA